LLLLFVIVIVGAATLLSWLIMCIISLAR